MSPIFAGIMASTIRSNSRYNLRPRVRSVKLDLASLKTVHDKGYIDMDKNKEWQEIYDFQGRQLPEFQRLPRSESRLLINGADNVLLVGSTYDRPSTILLHQILVRDGHKYFIYWNEPSDLLVGLSWNVLYFPSLENMENIDGGALKMEEQVLAAKVKLHLEYTDEEYDEWQGVIEISGTAQDIANAIYAEENLDGTFFDGIAKFKPHEYRLQLST